MEGEGLANHSESRAVGATMAMCEVVCEVCFRMLRKEVAGKDTGVWKRDRSLSVNNVGQPTILV